MIAIADASDIVVWPAWVYPVLLGLAVAFVLLVGLCRAAARPAPRIAAPAPADSPQEQARAIPFHVTAERVTCWQRGHVYADWARTATHLLCVRCGDKVKRIPSEPFDQERAS